MKDERDEGGLCDEFVAGRRSPKERAATRTVSTARLREEEQRAKGMMKDGDWSAATASTFVALYSLLYERVYGVPMRTTGRERQLAVLRAGQMLRADFDGDAGAMATFMRWTWKREAEREEWRRQNARDGGSIGWKLQFGTHVLGDYRLAQARRSGR